MQEEPAKLLENNIGLKTIKTRDDRVLLVTSRPTKITHKMCIAGMGKLDNLASL